MSAELKSLVGNVDIQKNSSKIIFTEEEIERRKFELREKNRRDRVAIINYTVKQALTEQEQKYAQEEENRIISLIKKGKSLEDIMDFFRFPKNVFSKFLIKTRKIYNIGISRYTCLRQVRALRG